MGVVRKLCPNSILLRDGIILNSGETDKVINYYLNSDGDSSTAVIKLPKSEDNSNEKGYGLQLIIRDQSGKLRTQFKIGEKWVIQLNFKINRNLNHIIAGIGLANSESTPIITYWSQPADLKPGQYYVDFVCDLPLKATHLKMFVGLSQHERNFYFIQDIGSIEILRVSNADQPFRSEGSGLLLGNQDSIIYPLHD